MPSYAKAIVLDVLSQELERAQQTTARKHDEALAQHGRRDAQIRKARLDAVAAIRDMHAVTVASENEPDYYAAVDYKQLRNIMTPPTEWRREDKLENDLKMATEDFVDPPVLVRGRQERMLAHAVEIIGSFDGPSISFSDLRDLGVVEYLKVPKDVC